jgi:hypothetical protein
MGHVAAAVTNPQQLPPEDAEDSAIHRAAAEYASNLRGASTDLTPRSKRHTALLRALHAPEAAGREDR